MVTAARAGQVQPGRGFLIERKTGRAQDQDWKSLLLPGQCG